MTLEERLEKYLSKDPVIHPDAVVSKHAVLIGDVTVEADANIWPMCVLRADINSIVIGEGTNIQEGTMIHLADDADVVIGKNTTVGHGCIIHGCHIGDGCLIGMGATIMDKAVIGEGSIIGAGALVTKETVIPEHSLALGSPAKVVKVLDEKTRNGIKYWAMKYARLSKANKAKEAQSK